MRTTGVLPTVSRMLAYLAMGPDPSLLRLLKLLTRCRVSDPSRHGKAALSSSRHRMAYRGRLLPGNESIPRGRRTAPLALCRPACRFGGTLLSLRQNRPGEMPMLRRRFIALGGAA